MERLHSVLFTRCSLLACLVLLLAGCVSTPSEFKEPPPLSAEARAALNQKVFVKAVALVDKHYFDPTYNGADWPALQARYQPQAHSAQDSAAFYRVLARMFNEMGVSHLAAFPPRDAHQFQDEHRASVGLALQLIENSLVVTEVVPGSPAAAAGIQPGWLMTARNGEHMPVANDKFLTVLGQTVRYDFLDAQDQVHSFVLDPALVNFNKQEARSLRDGLLYLRFDIFNFAAMRWLSQQLKANSNAPGVVLDLRFNGGGNLAVTMVALGEFNQGIRDMQTVGTSVQRSGKQHEVMSLPLFSAKYSGKVVILVDGRSASAAEIFPAVMQYHKRATVVGRPTAGKVLSSQFYDLPDGGLLQIPIADFLGPDGQRLEGKGVTPDRVLPAATLAQRRAGEDPDIDAAIAMLLQSSPASTAAQR